MADGQSESVKSCAYDDCERDVDGEEWCYWHREEDGKCPEDDLELDDGFPVDLAGAYLVEADLSEAALGSIFDSDRTPADLTDANLSSADLTGADLSSVNLTDATLLSAELIGANLSYTDLISAYLENADLTNAQFYDSNISDAFVESANFTNAIIEDSDLSGAYLHNIDFTKATVILSDFTNTNLASSDITEGNLSHVDFTGASLNAANLTDVDLTGADLTNVDLRGSTLHRTDLREATITNLTLDRETTISDLPMPTDDDTTDHTEQEGYTTDDQSNEPEIEPNDWDRVARVYHALKQEFDANGFVTRARRFHQLERRARRHETRVEEDWGWFSRAHLAQFASGYVTGYGVGVKRIAGIGTALFFISTAAYLLADVENYLTYSAITFATAPPYGVRDLPLYARFVAGFETIFGTLLLITLGFVLSNREQF